MHPSSNHLRYRPEVDGLRALAVVPVILFHAGFELFSGGYVGVDIFFVISGYLITSIILSEQNAGRFSIIGFYERRARRILPALFFMMALCIPFAWLWMTPTELRDFAKSVVAVIFFASNIFFWKESDYFDSASEEKPLLHTWSLGVEEQYYLLFPIFLILTWRLGKQRQAWIIIAFCALSLTLSEWGWRNNPNANFYLAPTRAWELLIGSLLAFWSATTPLHQRVDRRQADILSALGLLLIIFSIVAYDSTTPIPGIYALAPTVGTALILSFATSATAVGRFLSWRWVVAVGLVSYSAYLWHQPLFAFARLRSTEQPTDATFLALSATAIGLAYVSWRYIEAPFRNRRKITRGPIFALSIMGSVAFLFAGALGIVGDGFPDRLNATARALMDTAIPSPKRDACHTGGRDFTPPAQACEYFNTNVTWATFGDSHVTEPSYTLAEHLDTKGQGLVHLSFSGCGPSILYESKEPGCTRWQREALAKVENDARVVNVLVAFRYRSSMSDDQPGEFPVNPNSPPAFDGSSPAASGNLIWESFTTIIQRLRDSGKRVYVLGPIPELGRPIQQNIFAQQFKNDVSFKLGISRASYEARNRRVLDKLKTLPWGDDLVLVDPTSVLCTDRECHAVIDGQAMYFDDNHLSLAGARRVLSQITDRLDGSAEPPSTAQQVGNTTPQPNLARKSVGAVR